MKKAIISAIVLITLMAVLGVNIYLSKQDINNLIELNKKIEAIVLKDKELSSFIRYSNDYINFDMIENQIRNLENNLQKVLSSDTLQKLKNPKIVQGIKTLDQKFDQKIGLLQNIKSINAVITNSYRFIPKIKEKISAKNLNELYTLILTVNHVENVNIKNEIEKIQQIQTSDIFEKVFLNHTRIILEETLEFNNIQKKLKKLHLESNLREFLNAYEKTAQKSINKAQNSIIILFILLAVFIGVYLIYSYKILYKSIQFERFKKSVEESDNIIVVTDENEFIKYVNDAFTRSTGYTKEEVIGKKPNILKSERHPPEFYRKLHDTIHSGKKWNGEFINRSKSGELSYERASITPVLDNNGEIVEFIALKLDITKDILMQRELESQKEQLKQQSKMAAMGEMLENIAHQWRQPLSVISTAVTGLQAKKEYGLSNKEEELETLNLINDTVQDLSQTISDFQDFFQPDTAKSYFKLDDILKRALKTIDQKLKEEQVAVINEVQNIEVLNFKNEMIQVLVNILNNAKDALQDSENKQKLLFITTEQNKDEVRIKILDNAGGIPKDIIDKIFEPYFTTKHQFQGTGIGLYMAQEMLEKHMNGSIDIVNKSFEYDNIPYIGAEVIITLQQEK